MSQRRRRVDAAQVEVDQSFFSFFSISFGRRPSRDIRHGYCACCQTNMMNRPLIISNMDVGDSTFDCEDRPASQTSRLRFPMWFLLQALIFFAVMASNIAWHWAPNLYVAALIGVGLAIGATQIVTGIQYLAAVLRRNRRP